jgi:hypothetical protein
MYVLIVTIFINLGFTQGAFQGHSDDTYSSLAECRVDAERKNAILEFAQRGNVIEKTFECKKVNDKPDA